MITHVQPQSGYITKLPLVGNKRFEFSEGLNIMFGPNGCGKTSLLRLVAAYAGIARDDHGWSSPVFDSSESMSAIWDKSIKPSAYPSRFRLHAPGKCEADVGWDGSAALMFRESTARMSYLSDDVEEFDDQLAMAFGNPSSGMNRIGRINRLEETLEKAPNVSDRTRSYSYAGNHITSGKVNSTWQEYFDSFYAYVDTLPCNGRITVLIDEPDASMSLPNQCALWQVVMPRVAQKYQVIVATHSPFALVAKDARVVEFDDGYVERCSDALRKSFGAL